VLTAAYDAIDEVMNKTNNYVNQWTRYQALWDLQQEILFDRLGTDLNNWMKVENKNNIPITYFNVEKIFRPYWI
jgi:dynein heavy chain 1